MSNLRIYTVIGTFHPWVGGAEKQALAQCRSLRERDFEVTLVTFRHNKQWPCQEEVENVPVLRVAGSLLGRRQKLPRIVQKLLYVLALVMMGWTLWHQRRHYDVLHVYQFYMLVLPVAFVCWLADKPMIIVVQDAGKGKSEQVNNKLSFIAGILNNFLPWLQIEALSEVGGDLANLQRLGKPGVYFTHVLLRHIKVVPIIISSRMKDYLAEYDFNFSDIQLIPNCVDISRFIPIKTDISCYAKNQVVICTARLCYQKGLDVLIRAWSIVHMDLPQVRLLIAGIGPLQAQLEYMVRELDLTDCIEFVGLQEDIPALLHQGTVAVLPSRWEGMSVALLEAMACGLPCVATRVSGSEDIIQHGINGLLVDSEDYESMADALLLLIQDAELAEKYGKAARLTVEQYYSLDQITDKYINQYQRMMSKL